MLKRQSFFLFMFLQGLQTTQWWLLADGVKQQQKKKKKYIKNDLHSEPLTAVGGDRGDCSLSQLAMGVIT